MYDLFRIVTVRFVILSIVLIIYLLYLFAYFISDFIFIILLVLNSSEF